MATKWDTAVQAIEVAAMAKPDTGSAARIVELQALQQGLIRALAVQPKIDVAVALPDRLLQLGFGPVEWGKRGLYVVLPGDVRVPLFARDRATMLLAYDHIDALLAALGTAVSEAPAAGVRGARPE
jgi:hypothetical protein